MGTASTRAAKNERQASPPARIGSLRGRKRAKIRFWRNKAHHTRMMGMQNLPLPHALLRRAYPNDRTVKPAISTRAAGNRFTRQRILAQIVRAGQYFLFALFHSRQGVWGLPHVYSWPSTFRIPMPETRNLQSPHALLRRAYPNDRTVKLAISTRAASNHFAKRHMLASCVLAVPHLLTDIK